MLNLRYKTAFVIALANLCFVQGCNNYYTPIISEYGVFVSVLRNNTVHVRMAPKATAPHQKNIFARVERDSTVILRKTVEWDYATGVEFDLGSENQPLRAGDMVLIGTNEINSYVSVIVTP